jgi:hypothetical protein
MYPKYLDQCAKLTIPFTLIYTGRRKFKLFYFPFSLATNEIWGLACKKASSIYTVSHYVCFTAPLTLCLMVLLLLLFAPLTFLFFLIILSPLLPEQHPLRF